MSPTAFHSRKQSPILAFARPLTSSNWRIKVSEKKAITRPEETATTETSPEDRAFSSALNSLHVELDGCRHAANVAINALKPQSEKNVDDLRKLLADLERWSADDAGEKKLTLDEKKEMSRRYVSTMKEASKQISAIYVIPRSIFIAALSIWDKYICDLMEIVISKHPATIGVTKDVNIELLLKAKSLNEVKQKLIRDFIYSFSRSSRIEQIKKFEKQFKINISDKYDRVPAFVEIAERRNLLVHAGGVVSDEYRLILKKFDIPLKFIKEKDGTLYISSSYLKDTIDLLYELGSFLGYALWYKLEKSNKEKQTDNHAINFGYELMKNQKYPEAIRFHDWILKYHSGDIREEASRLRLTVNYANTYRLLGDHKSCAKVLSEIDWSAKNDMFRLAEAILSNRTAAAIGLMRKVGNSISDDQYREWPLFIGFSDSAEFREAFREIFNQEFNSPAPADISTVQNLVESVKRTEVEAQPKSGSDS